jgi:hypothetical protein
MVPGKKAKKLKQKKYQKLFYTLVYLPSGTFSG